MKKILWYAYFGLYMIYISLSRIKIYFIKKKSEQQASIYAHKKGQQIARHILKITKTKTEVSGIENLPQGPCVFVPNHQAIFDAFILGAFIDKPFGFIAKKEIKKIPLVYGILKVFNTVFIDRKSPKDSVRAINQGVEILKQGHCMVIFPEGTRSLSSEMNNFKKGSMKLALKAKVPIVPITLDGTYRVLENGEHVTGNTIKMVIHKPIYTDNLSREEQNELAEKIEKIVRDELYRIRD